MGSRTDAQSSFTHEDVEGRSSGRLGARATSRDEGGSPQGRGTLNPMAQTRYGEERAGPYLQGASHRGYGHERSYSSDARTSNGNTRSRQHDRSYDNAADRYHRDDNRDMSGYDDREGVSRGHGGDHQQTRGRGGAPNHDRNYYRNLSARDREQS